MKAPVILYISSHLVDQSISTEKGYKYNSDFLSKGFILQDQPM